MKWLKINNRIVNMDQVTFVQRLEGGAVWLRRDEETNLATFDPEEGAKLWQYLLSAAPDVMEIDL